MTAFIAYPKTPRLFRDVIVTEKIDGTNAGIQILSVDEDEPNDGDVVTTHGNYRVIAQSRKRLITSEDDNFGFATWVEAHAANLAEVLGEGVHYGEWWGSGIQRGYGLEKGEKRFSLFNVGRWASVDLSSVRGLGVVPTLYEGVFDQDIIKGLVTELRRDGSFLPALDRRFPKAEGVIVFHTQSRQVYKVLVENDEVSKTEAGVA